MAKVAIHTVFIAKENILFMEEWIDYHMQLGFNAFYLYDNSKVEKVVGHNKHLKHMVAGKVSRNKINYDKLINLTKHEINDMLYKIKEKYKGVVHMIDWSPRDSDGKIVHLQDKAHANCLQRLKKTDVNWCAVVDMDEYIVLPFEKTIQDYLSHVDATCIILRQNMFDSRFNNMNKRVVEINKATIDKIPANFIYNKYIFKVQDTNRITIHRCKGNGSTSNPVDIFYNHYKYNSKENPERFHIVPSNMDPAIVSKVLENSKEYIRPEKRPKHQTRYNSRHGSARTVTRKSS